MEAKTFIQSWPGLWLWMQFLSQRLVGGSIRTAYTYRKGRLDMEIELNDEAALLSWEKHGNRAMLSLSDRFSTPRKKVHVFSELDLNKLTITQITLNEADRALKFTLSDSTELLIGMYPSALNAYVLKDSEILGSFLKDTGKPEFAQNWLGPEDQLPNPVPFGDNLGFDLEAGLEGLLYDEDAGKISASTDYQGLNIANLTRIVQKGSRPRKQVNTQSIRKTAGNVKKRWKRKLKKVSAELSEAENWPQLEQDMQALQLAQAYGLSAQAGSIKISAEQSPTGEAVTVKVDGLISLSDNISLYAKRIRKSKEKLETLSRIIPEIERDIQTLTQHMEGEDEEPLKAFLITKGEALEQDGSQRAERKPYKKYTSPGGFDILVGRTSSDNDTLTFKVAGKNDWWFHARQIRGSHVILRCGRTEPAQADIQRAAELAALNSKAKHSGIAVVQYCQRKHLSKPKGSPPGTVLVHHEKSITVDLTDLEEI